MTKEQKEAAALLAARFAAADMLRAAREFHAAAARLTGAIAEWDPDGAKDDAMILGCAETTEGVLVAAAHTSTGIAGHFRAVVRALDKKVQ